MREVGPRRVHHALGETVVLVHPVNREVFDRDEPVAVHELARLLVSEVGTSVLDALVDPRNYLAPLCSVAGALRGLGGSG